MIWLLKNWRLAGFGLLVLAFGLYVGYLKLQITAISADLRAARAEIGALSVRVAERDALLETQNRAVEGWRAAGVENARLLKLAEQRALKASEEGRRLARDLLAVKVPDSCEGSIQWLRDTAPSLSW